MIYLTFIRNGQSTYNLPNLFTGKVAASLTLLGEPEAPATDKKEYVYNINYIYAYKDTGKFMNYFKRDSANNNTCY